MTKKITLICILMVLVFVCTYFSAYASDSISLVINNKKVECEVPPVIVNSRTLVPVRVLFEHLDAKVDWNGSLRQVMVTSGTTVMIFNIDSKIVYLNGAIHTLDAAPVIMNDRTLVPVRFISEKLGFIVGWDGSARCVSITKPKEHSSSVSITKPSQDDENDKRIKLTSVKLNETKSSYEITVALEKKITPKTMSLKEPYRLIFDFYDVNYFFVFLPNPRFMQIAIIHTSATSVRIKAKSPFEENPGLQPLDQYRLKVSIITEAEQKKLRITETIFNLLFLISQFLAASV